MSDFDDVVYVETDDKPMGPGINHNKVIGL